MLRLVNQVRQTTGCQQLEIHYLVIKGLRSQSTALYLFQRCLLILSFLMRPHRFKGFAQQRLASLGHAF